MSAMLRRLPVRPALGDSGEKKRDSISGATASLSKWPASEALLSRDKEWSGSGARRRCFGSLPATDSWSSASSGVSS